MRTAIRGQLYNELHGESAGIMDFHIDTLLNFPRQVRVFDRGSKFLLLRNGVVLTESEKQALDQILQQSKRLRKAYESKEELRAIYESPLMVETGRLHLEEWLNRAQNIYSEVTTTIRRHLDGICNYFRARTTSESMEGINNRIKLIRRSPEKNLPCHYREGGNPAPEFLNIGYFLFQNTP
jgi:hypothetical protein